MANKRWVRFNAINGAILEDLAVNEDDIKVDINGYDEVNLNIPAYTLPDEARLNWANEYFRPWTVGVALINDDTNTCEAAGIVVKRGFTGSTEMITVVAYNVAEYLKKVRLPAIYSNLTSNSTLTLSGANWGEVYAEAIRAGMNMSGAPAGTTYYSNLVLTPKTGSTITRTIERKNQTTVYGFITDLREGDETKGEEIRFIPTLDGTTIKWVQENGTTTVPQINSNIQLEASTTTISGTGSATWKTAEYTWDDDGTTIYNRLVINGSSDDEAPFVGVGGTTSPNTPTLTEAFDSGTDLSPTQMTEQLSSRLTGSMATSKNITVNIVEDVTNFWRTGVGTMLTIHSGEKTAGAGVYGRVVEINWNNTNTGEYELTVAPPASRYPRLPSQKERQPDYNNPGPGNGSTGGFDSGDLPDIRGGNGGTLPGGNFPTPGDPDYPDYEDGGIVWEEPEEPFAGDQENSARVVVNAKTVLPAYTVTIRNSHKITATPMGFNTYISTQFSTPSQNTLIDSRHSLGRVNAPRVGSYDITSYIIGHEGLNGERIASNQAEATVTQAQILNISYENIINAMMEHDPFPDQMIWNRGSWASSAPYGQYDILENMDIQTWSGNYSAIDFYINGYLYVLFTLRAGFRSTNGETGNRLARQAMFAIPFNETTGSMGTPVSIKSPFSTFSDRIRIMPKDRIPVRDNSHINGLSNFFTKGKEMWVITPDYTYNTEGAYVSRNMIDTAPIVEEIEDFRDGIYVNFDAPLAPYAQSAPYVAAIKPITISYTYNDAYTWNLDINTPPVRVPDGKVFLSRRYANPVQTIVNENKVYVFYNTDNTQDWNQNIENPSESARKKVGNRVYVATIGEWKWKSGKEFLIPRNVDPGSLPIFTPFMYLTPEGNIILDMENSSNNLLYKPNNRINYGRSSYIVSGENGTRGNILTDVSVMGEWSGKYPYISKTVNNKNYAIKWASYGSGTYYHRYSIVENMTYQKRFDEIGGKVWIEDGDLYEHSSASGNVTYQTHDGPKTLSSFSYPFTTKAGKWLMASSNYASSTISAMGVQEEGNTVYTWGISSVGANGNGLTTGDVSPAQPVAGLPGGEIKKILSVNLSKFVLYENGELWGWGGRVAGYAGPGSGNALTPILVRTGVLDFKCNNATLVVLDEFRKVWMTGSSLFSSGEVGWTEILLEDPSDIITKISLSSSKQLYALTSSGRVLGAGQRRYGMMGDGLNDNTYQLTLKLIATNMKEIGASEGVLFMISELDYVFFLGHKPVAGPVSWTFFPELVNTTNLPKFEKIYAENSFIYLTSSVGSIYTIGWTGAPGAVAYTPAGFARQFAADMPNNWATRPILIWHDVIDKLEDDDA